MQDENPESRTQPDRRRLPGRSALAQRLVVSSASLSRRLRFGSGSTVGGRVGLLVDPGLLVRLGAGRKIALVSGTNGKTTTTQLLAAAVATLGEVATSGSGANMSAGLVSALAASPSADYAVLEVDEAHLPAALSALRPDVVLLLNLSRDQLDRTSEVRMLAAKWREGLRNFSGRVVANADDPLVAWAAESASNVTWVGASSTWREDAHHCPVCDQRITFSEDGSGWHCKCGFSRPEPEFAIDASGLAHGSGVGIEVDLRLPGRFNQSNATMAAVGAMTFGLSFEGALSAMRTVDQVAGRFASHGITGREGRLLLAKNPAGWSELISLVERGNDPLVIGINARIADGHDPSWLWDVPFERFAGHLVVATGERRSDLALRLLHAGVEHAVATDAHGALADVPGKRADYIGNYTAFQDLRRDLRERPNHSGALVTSSARPVASAVRAADDATVETHPARRSPGSESAIRVVVVHPDLLGTYGDSGNGRVLANRAIWRGIPVELLLADSDGALPRGADIYCLGGGEDGPQARSVERLADGALASAVNDGAVVLGVCAGFQILGNSFPGPHGPVAGLGLLDVVTERGTPRAVGEVLVDVGGGLLASGFENHAGRTTRSSGEAAFGTVQIGVGNGDGTDGARRGRVLGTYLHGPALARNAWLADELLAIVVGRELAALDDSAEHRLLGERLAAARQRGRRGRTIGPSSSRKVRSRR